MDRPHWTASLPWWLSWLFVGGFGVACAFGSTVLPANLQVSGFVVGCLAMAVAGCGTIVHLVNEYRVNRDRPRLKLEPIHIIALGLLIALGGVGWQWLQSKPIPVFAAKPLATDAVPLVLPKAVMSPPSIKYSDAEKNELRDAIRQVVKLLDGDGEKLADQINAVLQVWDTIYNTNDFTAASTFINNVHVLERQVAQLRDNLVGKPGTLMYRYNSYSKELEFILQLPKEWQHDPLLNLQVMAVRFKDNFVTVKNATATSDPALIRNMLDLGLGVPQLQDAQKNYLDWIRDAKNRVEQLRHTLG
jgi:hypothetical protein